MNDRKLERIKGKIINLFITKILKMKIIQQKKNIERVLFVLPTHAIFSYKKFC